LGLRRGDFRTAAAAHRALPQTAAGRKAGQAMKELVPGPQHEAERPRHAVAADRKLAHGLGHLPDAVTAPREEGHDARPEALGYAVLVGDQDLTGNNVHGLVDRIVPREAAGRAGPSQDRRRAVGAFRKPLGARLRISLDDPRRSAIFKSFRELTV